MKKFLIRGYSKTGIYAHELEASNDCEAICKARPVLAKMAFGKIHTITHDCLNPDLDLVSGSNFNSFSNPDGI